MIIAIIVVVAIIVIAVLYYIAKRNSIIAARNRVDESWSGIDVQLKRRHDLVPEPGRDGQRLRRAREPDLREDDQSAGRGDGRPRASRTPPRPSRN